MILNTILEAGYCPAEPSLRTSFSFFTMKTCSIFQEESYASILSISYALNRNAMADSYFKFLVLSHNFGTLMNELYTLELKKVLPNLGCASCGKNTTVFIAADGCFKLSRAFKKTINTRKPCISTFFVQKEETVNAHRNDKRYELQIINS